MAILNSAAVYYESAQAQQVFAALTGNTARTTYTASSKPWSNAAGYEYTVAPYGLITGGEVTPHSTADDINVAALTAMMPAATGASATTGILSVSAVTDDSLTVTRGTGGNVYAVTSVTVTSGGALAMLGGTAHTATSTERGASGGPPNIPLGSIEIAQVKVTSTSSAVVSASEIYQVVGDSQERYDFPVYNTDPIRGQITFAAALPLTHAVASTGAATAAKLVYARVATPVFAEISRARNWVPAETSNSTNSEQYYDVTVGSFSSSLGQASFEASLNDGVTDTLVGKRGLNLLFKFSPDKNKAPYQVTQGVLGVSRTFEVGANPSVSFTVSAQQESVDFAA